jgi:hypothetical protein
VKSVKNVINVGSSYEFWRLGGRTAKEDILTKFNKSQNDFKRREPVTPMQGRNIKTPENVR